MKQRNIFTKLAIAVVLGGCLAACSDDDKPVIIDANGEKWQVTSAGGFFFTYDEDGYLTSIRDNTTTYNVQKDKFVVSGFYKGSSVNAEFTFDKNNNITKVVESETGFDNDGNYTAEMTLDYTYDSDQRLKSCTGTSKWQQEPGYYENATATINYGWGSNQLTVSYNGTSSGYEGKDDYWNNNYNNTFVYTLGSQPNRSKQLPYYMTSSMLQTPLEGGEDFELGSILAVLGLFGYGPEYLPTGYSRTYMENGREKWSDNYVFSFTQNSNGTLMQEKTGDKTISSNDNGFNYIYTPTRAEGVATQSLMELLYNSMKRTPHRERKQ